MTILYCSENPSLTHSVILSNLCKPLKKIGISFFGFTAVDDAQNAYCLGSKPNYAEQYLSSQFVQDDAHYRAYIASKRFEYQFWDFLPLNQRAEKLYRMAAEFDQSHTLTITHHNTHMTRCYHFSGQCFDHGINQRYLEYLDTLHAFIDYFETCLAQIPELAALFNQPIPIVSPQRLSNNSTKILVTQAQHIDLAKQANSTIIFKNYANYGLTKKERECLYWMRRGKSADMIAAILYTSGKTIERRVASIKIKLACDTPFELGAACAERFLTEFL